MDGQNKGSILYKSYADYMKEKLFSPESGYYVQTRQKIGKEGDFYTSSQFKVFAKLIAKYFIRLVKEHDLEPVFVEIGSGTGLFAENFMEEVERTEGVNIKNFRYFSIESSPFHQNQQLKRIKKPYFTVMNNIDGLGLIEGVVFSNEFFDCLPVHAVQKLKGKLYEIFVCSSENTYSEKHIPLENDRIKGYLDRFSEWVIQEGQRIEIPLLMLEIYSKIIYKLKKGFIITVDYGYRFPQVQDPALKNGTLRGYYKHRMIKAEKTPFKTMDITSHIHWDALLDEGEKQGLETVAWLTQREFLLQLGILKELLEHHSRDPFSESQKWNRSIRTLISEEGLGRYFQVLIQKKLKKTTPVG